MNWRLRWAKSLFGILLVGLTSAGKDTVVLTTGESIEGHMISADENTLRFRDSRGIIEEIPREKVSSIRLQPATPLTSQPLASTAEPEKASSAATEPPEGQKEFCELVTSFQREQLAYVQETNPIRKAGMRTPDPYRYESQVRDLFGPKHEFVNWTGTLRFGTSGRSIGITFTPTCDPQQLIQFGNAIEQPGFSVQDSAGTILCGATAGAGRYLNPMHLTSRSRLTTRRTASAATSLRKPMTGFT